jgi:hypothetical protein
MLLFLQYVAIVLVNSTNISSQIVSNFHTSQQLKKTANKAIDFVINNKDHFINYTRYLNSDGQFFIDLSSVTPPSFSAKIISFKCIDRAVFDAYLVCNLNNKYWELTIQVDDTASIASIQIVQGVRLNGALKDTTVQPQIFHIERVWWYVPQLFNRRLSQSAGAYVEFFDKFQLSAFRSPKKFLCPQENHQSHHKKDPIQLHPLFVG